MSGKNTHEIFNGKVYFTHELFFSYFRSLIECREYIKSVLRPNIKLLNSFAFRSGLCGRNQRLNLLLILSEFK